MRIKIAERLRPYSHQPGVSVILPFTNVRLQIFPALIRLYRLDRSEPLLLAAFPLKIEGPLSQFTVCQDLEKGCVLIWDQGPAGFRRVRISVRDGDIVLTCERGTTALQCSSGAQQLSAQESIVLLSQDMLLSIPSYLPLERLSLGSHRTQDCARWRTQMDLHTLLPFWLRLGRMVPDPGPVLQTGTAKLLSDLPHMSRDQLYSAFQQVLLAGFEGLLSPRLIDTDYQGLNLSPPDQGTSPLVLLTEGSKLIRNLFIQQHEQILDLLPALPPEFHCGRFTGIDCQGLASLDLEWSKKLLHRMVLIPKRDSTWTFQCQRDLRRFRLRRTMNEPGLIHPCGTSLLLQANVPYFFDRFEK